ncbi:acyltransferase [Streptomyces sp. WAC 01529]|uniref:acyltransferase family protein n=1 Tax=Streptomyces sp. WAC 01529 TaxID=2203205 RepID=UPI000F6CCECA|nr:acyltransferase [Streptomyces sp. WAC 01529]AZM54479.1 acyltransferase [Streptomyces sp. WAC 01529]
MREFVRGTVRQLARNIRHIEAATPADRDRAVDALRALAVLGVVGGHWLVTALVADGGALRAASPLRYLPWLAPVSWIFQTLAVFFLVGGHVAAKSLASARARGSGYLPWLTARLGRLFRPVTAVLSVWSVIGVCLLLSGAGPDTAHTLLKLALSPLWFLLVLAALTAATPLVARLNPLWPLAVVLHVDLVRFGFGGPAWLGWVNVAAGWLVPWTLGTAWARGELTRRSGRVLLVGGAAAAAGLVRWGGYPASMVGVPGDAVSNLDPPTLAAVAFGLAQCGLALLLREPLARWTRRPAAWAAVALVNLSAMTVFLWHQTALMAVTALGLLTGGPLPGLHTVPDGLGWVAARLAWLPVFAVALAVCRAAFLTYERGRPKRRGGASRVVRVHRSPGASETATGTEGEAARRG